MYRTIRFQGVAERVDDLEVIDAWQQRTWEAQISAVASEQSRPISGREEFDSRLEAARLSYPRGSEVPMPESFAGWRIRCSSVEFWSGRADRSHDRLMFTNPSDLELDNPGWHVTRLMP
ncbi:ribose-phosphate pyrophosphokinase [Platysternon megacephalum]|uniref:pyridoxal 5'-phosphate synthase n=1 Tax=Platysternon megacephalum TaxID=55544 RepID=A0A4D9DC84_9SAUR|nr:ribose-phosphate pyrophosphokinase [Platysternon megacephalum]